jgi:TetR/AcrR family transcriptional regulator
MRGQTSTTRRERILAAAAQEFAAHGFSGARVDQIAALAAVNKQLLFYYFGSKAGLHDAAIVALLDRAQIRTSPQGQPAERLRELVAQLQLVTARSPALLSILADFSGAAAVTPGAQRAIGDWYGRAIGSARQILEDGQRSGHFRDDLDAGPIAELIVSGSLGTTAPAAWSGSADARDARARIRDALVRLVIDYCVWR